MYIAKVITGNHFSDGLLVIADLTNDNPNVFYELAIRHLTQKPYIQISNFGQKIPSDVNGMRNTFFNMDLELAEAAKEEFYNQVQSIENREFKSANPITLAHNYSIIQKRLQYEKQELKEDISNAVLEAVNNVTYSMNRLKNEFYLLKNSIHNSNREDLNNDNKIISIGKCHLYGKYVGEENLMRAYGAMFCRDNEKMKSLLEL